jgi:hypothetical protein
MTFEREQEDVEDSIKKALQKIPRRSYAEAQGMRFLAEMNGLLITRSTRRYWVINGSELKLQGAVKRVLEDAPVEA